MSAQDNPLLIPVYMPSGSPRNYGPMGVRPARIAQKNTLRALLEKHAGNPTAEAIRDYLNERRESPETVITINDAAPAIAYLSTIGRL